MGEQPLFSAKAHVFQIDPATKRNWVPASKHALTVSFFYDIGRSAYRIICVGGTKAIINSTITPSMTFTRTSQKFGQWADSRANAVFGLGFGTEQQLQQELATYPFLVDETQLFSEQFKEYREAARLVREKSQEKFELSSPGLNIAAPQVLADDCQSPPPLLCANGPEEDKLLHSKSADMELASEKEHVKKILSQGSICEADMEVELCTLQESNAKLVEALHDANRSIEQWKKQLAEYQEETDKLREQVSELEAHAACPAPSEKRREELSQSVEEMEALLKAKDEEITSLQSKKSDLGELEKEREEVNRRIQELQEKNAELEQQVEKAEQNLATTQEARQRVEHEVRKAVDALDLKIFDLNNLRQSLAGLLDK